MFCVGPVAAGSMVGVGDGDGVGVGVVLAAAITVGVGLAVDSWEACLDFEQPHRPANNRMKAIAAAAIVLRLMSALLNYLYAPEWYSCSEGGSSSASPPPIASSSSSADKSLQFNDIQRGRSSLKTAPSCKLQGNPILSKSNRKSFSPQMNADQRRFLEDGRAPTPLAGRCFKRRKPRLTPIITGQNQSGARDFLPRPPLLFKTNTT